MSTNFTGNRFTRNHSHYYKCFTFSGLVTYVFLCMCMRVRCRYCGCAQLSVDPVSQNTHFSQMRVQRVHNCTVQWPHLPNLVLAQFDILLGPLSPAIFLIWQHQEVICDCSGINAKQKTKQYRARALFCAGYTHAHIIFTLTSWLYISISILNLPAANLSHGACQSVIDAVAQCSVCHPYKQTKQKSHTYAHTHIYSYTQYAHYLGPKMNNELENSPSRLTTVLGCDELSPPPPDTFLSTEQYIFTGRAPFWLTQINFHRTAVGIPYHNIFVKFKTTNPIRNTPRPLKSRNWCEVCGAHARKQSKIQCDHGDGEKFPAGCVKNVHRSGWAMWMVFVMRIAYMWAERI